MTPQDKGPMYRDIVYVDRPGIKNALKDFRNGLLNGKDDNWNPLRGPFYLVSIFSLGSLIAYPNATPEMLNVGEKGFMVLGALWAFGHVKDGFSYAIKGHVQRRHTVRKEEKAGKNVYFYR